MVVVRINFESYSMIKGLVGLIYNIFRFVSKHYLALN